MEIRDAVAADFDRHDWRDAPEKEPEYHRSLFRGIESNSVLTGKNIYIQRNGLPAQKVKRAFAGFLMARGKPEGSIEVGATITFGGGQGTKSEYYVSGEIKDNNSSAHIDVTTKDDGRTEIDVGGKVSTEDNNSSK